VGVAGRASGARPARLLGLLAIGVVVGAASGVLGTASHLWTDGRWPRGLGLAVALVIAVDMTLLAAAPRAVLALADAAGRALVVAVALLRGHGGDVVLQGGWVSEVWILLAVLIPAFAGPPLATMSAVRRARSGRAR